MLSVKKRDLGVRLQPRRGIASELMMIISVRLTPSLRRANARLRPHRSSRWAPRPTQALPTRRPSFFSIGSGGKNCANSSIPEEKIIFNHTGGGQRHDKFTVFSLSSKSFAIENQMN